MYLNRKQLQALNIASDALQGCLENNIEPQKSAFAIDILADMKIKDRKAKQKKKNKKVKEED